jgi:hypothetical protein
MPLSHNRLRERAEQAARLSQAMTVATERERLAQYARELFDELRRQEEADEKEKPTPKSIDHGRQAHASL